MTHQFTRDYFHHFLVRSSFFPDSLTEAMKDAYLQTERSFMALAPTRRWESGCTAVTALVQGDRLTVGHVGDSRLVLCRQGRAVALTKDHSPNDPDEVERIEKEGAVVINGLVGQLYLPYILCGFHLPGAALRVLSRCCHSLCVPAMTSTLVWGFRFRISWAWHAASVITTSSRDVKFRVSVRNQQYLNWYCKTATSFCWLVVAVSFPFAFSCYLCY
jgi:hypothetical protein